MKEEYTINGYWFLKTGRKSNLGSEYEIRKDMGDYWHQYHNLYFATQSQIFEYAWNQDDEEA